MPGRPTDLVTHGRPSLAVGPRPDAQFEGAVRSGGGVVVDDGQADGLIWWSFGSSGLEAAMQEHPGLRWVQLPMAGVERVVENGAGS